MRLKTQGTVSFGSVHRWWESWRPTVPLGTFTWPAKHLCIRHIQIKPWDCSKWPLQPKILSRAEEMKAHVLGQDSSWVSPNTGAVGGAPIGDPAVAGWTPRSRASASSQLWPFESFQQALKYSQFSHWVKGPSCLSLLFCARNCRISNPFCDPILMASQTHTMAVSVYVGFLSHHQPIMPSVLTQLSKT